MAQPPPPYEDYSWLAFPKEKRLIPYMNNVSQLLKRRAKTHPAPKNGILDSVKRFVEQHLKTVSEVTSPINDIVIAAHADPAGVFGAPLYPGQEEATDYELVNSVMPPSLRQIVVDPAITGSDLSKKHFVHLKGCSLGKAEGFLARLLESFGTAIDGITAPKHVHGVSFDPHSGAYETMSYQFQIRFQLPNVKPCAASFRRSISAQWNLRSRRRCGCSRWW